ncbi:O-antigen ligase family protein, partial [Candidatus Aerophobetes bacterium]|nr:O-antigen ligase family protein [Candidatus Aerophobetes bacterium]
QITCLFLLCGFSFAVLSCKLKPPPFSRTSFFVALFGIYLLLSVLWSRSFYASFLNLGVWGSYIAIYFMGLSLITSRKWENIMVMAVVLSGAIAALYSIFQFYGLDLPIWRKVPGRMRLFSTFGNPNYLAGYLAASLHLGFFLLFREKKRKGIFLFTICILYAALLITQTRGAWVALFTSTVFVLFLFLVFKRDFFRKNARYLALLSFLIFILTLVYLFPNPLNMKKVDVAGRVASVTNFSREAKQRLLIWQAALGIIKENPLFGRGTGTFRVFYPLYQGKFLSKKENIDYIPRANISINAHNDYLQIISEGGAIGFFLFLLVIAGFYYNIFSLLRKKRASFSLIFFSGAITSFLIHAIVSFPFHIIQNGMVFWLLLALVERKKQPTRKTQKKFSLPSFLKWLIILIIFAGGIYLGYLRTRVFISDLYAKKGEILIEAGSFSLARKELERAVKINPFNAEAFINLARCYNYLGLYPEAVEVCNRAKTDRNVPTLYNQIAFSYLKMGKIDEAKKALEKCLFLYPNFAAGYINYGNILLYEAEKNIQGKEYTKAEEKLDEAFLFFSQATLFEKNFKLPDKLTGLYIRLQKEKKSSVFSELKTLSPFFNFYSREKYFLFILPPSPREKENPFLAVFAFSREDKTSPEKKLSLKIKLKEKETLYEKILFSAEFEQEKPYILKLKLPDKLRKGKYVIMADILQN